MFAAKNIIGCFVFTKDKIIDNILFKEKDTLNYEDEPKELKNLMKKHNATLASLDEQKILLKLMEDKYKQEFHNANLIITKKKVKESVHSDNLIIQAISNIDELDRTANLLSKRLREWYELYAPEVSRNEFDHEKFVKKIINQSKEELLKETNITFTMGAEFEKDDLKPILDLAEKIKEIYEFREVQKNYIEKVMKKEFRNLEVVCGSQIGAKLIAHAGGISRLSEFPASTIQILGAEKALFRHMKTGAKPPKYGIIINHPLITNADKKDKGRVARTLANKISIAAKVDNFKGEFVGDKLKEQLEKKFK